MLTLQRWTRLRFAGLGFAVMLASTAGIAVAQTESQTRPPDQIETPTTHMPGDHTQTPAVDTVKTDATAPAAVETAIKEWPENLKTLAKSLIERYGAPSTIEEKELVWSDNGPWRRTVLSKEGFTQSTMGKSRDHLEQAISYKVPSGKAAEIKRFDKRIEVNEAANELSSRADSESMNYLALNLADDIVKGQRSVQGARVFYQKVKMLERAGKSSPYLDGLIFTVSTPAMDDSGKKTDSDKGTSTESGMGTESDKSVMPPAEEGTRPLKQ